MVEETKQDLLLKRIQAIVAILGGIAALAFTLYSLRSTIFPDSGSGSLSVTVRSEQGGALGQARLEIYNSQNTVVGSSQTGGDGSYNMKSLSIGNYTLKVSAIGFEPQVVTFRVSAKDETRLDIAMKLIGIAKSTSKNTTKRTTKSTTKSDPIRSVAEGVGASLIKKLATPQK